VVAREPNRSPARPATPRTPTPKAPSVPVVATTEEEPCDVSEETAVPDEVLPELDELFEADFDFVDVDFTPESEVGLPY
jgi:hypothetical protein